MGGRGGYGGGSLEEAGWKGGGSVIGFRTSNV